jgi:hypothetical protein
MKFTSDKPNSGYFKNINRRENIDKSS